MESLERIIKYDRKGQIGLDMIRSFMVLLLILGVLGFAIIVAVSSLDKSNVAQTTATANINETHNFTGVGSGTATSVINASSGSLISSSVIVINNSGSGATLTSSNYTVSGAFVDAVSGSLFIGQTVRIMGTYNYIDPKFTGISNNITGGISLFFGNSTTFFAILAAVVIILAVVLIIVAITKFTSVGTTI